MGAQHGVDLAFEFDSDTFGNTNVDQNPVDGTNATIFQTISTEAGQSYTLSFWYAPRPGAAASSGLEVRFGGDLVFELLPNANNPAVWQQLTVTVTADGPSSVLAFTSTGAQDELGIFIDNISLTASPILDDEDTTAHRSPATKIQGGPGDDEAQALSLPAPINFQRRRGHARSHPGDRRHRRERRCSVGAAGHLRCCQWHRHARATDDSTWTPDNLGGGTMTWGSANIPVALTLQVSANGDYTFTQYAPIAHEVAGTEDNLALSFGFAVIDRDGDSATGTMAAVVDDDTPVAANDTDSMTEYQVATGNVITDAAAGDAGDGDAGADAGGADGVSVTGVTGLGATTVFDGNFQAIGQYGTLTLNPDGSYSYTLTRLCRA